MFSTSFNLYCVGFISSKVEVIVHITFLLKLIETQFGGIYEKMRNSAISVFVCNGKEHCHRFLNLYNRVIKEIY